MIRTKVHRYETSDAVCAAVASLLAHGWQETQHHTYQNKFIIFASNFTETVLGNSIEMDIDLQGVGGRPNDRCKR
jgi:hypothetical protein